MSHRVIDEYEYDIPVSGGDTRDPPATVFPGPAVRGKEFRRGLVETQRRQDAKAQRK